MLASKLRARSMSELPCWCQLNAADRTAGVIGLVELRAGCAEGSQWIGTMGSVFPEMRCPALIFFRNSAKSVTIDRLFRLRAVATTVAGDN